CGAVQGGAAGPAHGLPRRQCAPGAVPPACPAPAGRPRRPGAARDGLPQHPLPLPPPTAGAGTAGPRGELAAGGLPRQRGPVVRPEPGRGAGPVPGRLTGRGSGPGPGRLSGRGPLSRLAFSAKTQKAQRPLSPGPVTVSGMTTTTPQGRTAPPTPDRDPVRVLVVDDEQSVTALLSTALRYEGWQIRSAADGEGAVRAAREFRPDAVVLDLVLPDMDGPAVLGWLRRELPDVPVLFLTAKDAAGDRVAGLTAGGDDHVTKPFGVEEVVARLRGLIRR